MKTFQVPLSTFVTTYVEVEAENAEEAAEKAYKIGAPGLMNLDHTYPDTGDWEVPDWFFDEEDQYDD